MKTLNKPEMTPLKVGDYFKVLQVTGDLGMTMPEHCSTKEAVIIVQKGKAILKLKEIEHTLGIHETFIIPAGENHELQITENFRAVVIMETDSEINFITL